MQQMKATPRGSFLIQIMILLTALFLERLGMATEPSRPDSHSLYIDLLLDPLFGLEFHPSEKRFKPAPDVVYDCKLIAERRGNLFLFGQVEHDGVRFFLLSGWVEDIPDGPRSDERHFSDEGDGGIIAAVSGKTCRATSAGYALSPSKEYRGKAQKDTGIDDEMLSRLLDDALDREIRAFGGRDRFLCLIARSIAANGQFAGPILTKLNKLGPVGSCKSSVPP